MSKVRSPVIKKHLSLTRDCRYAYGESRHGARKAIPKRNAIRRRQERRVAVALLAKVSQDGDKVDAVEGAIASRMRLKRINGFRKVEDIPLGEYIRIRLAYRKARRAFNE